MYTPEQNYNYLWLTLIMNVNPLIIYLKQDVFISSIHYLLVYKLICATLMTANKQMFLDDYIDLLIYLYEIVFY